MKKTIKSTSGTSFYDVTFKSNVDRLINSIGEPTIEDNTGEDKVNFEWRMETDEGDVFTIYDWKEYREIDKNETIEWHIGAKSRSVSVIAKGEITNKILINIIRNEILEK